MTDTGDELQAHKQQVLSPRQNDVLEQALRLLVEGGTALDDGEYCGAANCSKESPTNGLATAMVC